MKRRSEPAGPKKRGGIRCDGTGSSRGSSITQRPRGLRPSRSAPTLDLSSLLRAARVAAKHGASSCDALVDLHDDDDDDEASLSSGTTEVVAALQGALDELETSSDATEVVDDSNDEDDDDDDAEHDILLSLALPFSSSQSSMHRVNDPRRAIRVKHGLKGKGKTSSSRAGRSRVDDEECGEEVVDDLLRHHSSRRHENPYHAKPSSTMLIPPATPAQADSRVLTVVIDLDETIVWARQAHLSVRPFVMELLHACLRNHCEVVVWSASVPQYVNRILHAVNGVVHRQWYTYVIARSGLWYAENAQASVKDIRLLHRDLDRVMVIENSPASVQLQEGNVLLVEDFYGEDTEDQSLIFVGQVIERAAQAAMHGIPVAVAIQQDAVVVPMTFELAAEHSATGAPATVVSHGLRYTPRHAGGGGGGGRVYAGVAPVSVGE